MFAIITCLEQHDPAQLIWAVLICITSVGAGLSAYRRACAAQGGLGLAWLVMMAFLFGAGVWATHFIAMLAFGKSIAAAFGFDLTLASLLIAGGGFFAGAGFAAWSKNPAGRALGGGVCGLTIATMHFIGVAGMRLPARIVWDPTLLVLSIAIGVVAAAASLTVAGDFKRLWRALAAAGLLILAICGLHFTAMAAATLVPAPLAYEPGYYGREGLGLGVGLLAGVILICGAVVLTMDGMSKATTLAALRSSLNQAPCAIGFFDRDDRLTFWNENFAEVVRLYGGEARRGQTHQHLLALARERGLPAHVADVPPRAGPGVSAHEFSLFSAPDGRWFEARSGATHDGGFVVLLNDVTAQRELIEQQAQAQALAERVSRAKSEFLANTSHEIRTPLSAVLGMVQVMERHPLDPDQRRRLQLIADSGNALLAVLNSVLDLAKIEAGKLELDEHDFDLAQTVRVAVSSFETLAVQKELALTVEVTPEVSGVWRGDSDRLRQVLSNLVSNAVKFTPQGHVAVRVAPGEEGVRFSVVDSGIGVAPDKQALIFEAFAQADASTTRKFGGTGLGLAICSSIVRTMGGRLELHSTPGQGSEFAFVLPLGRVEAAPVAAVPAAADDAPPPLRILVAEDNPNNQLVLSALLEPFGVELTVVGDGQAAVDACAVGGFDVVLMDVQMPRMNGVEATQAIRRMERERGLPRLPIIALTANVMTHQVAEYLQAGMDSFVAKPIQLGELVTALAAVPPRAVSAAA